AGARLVLDHHLLAPHFGEPRAEDAADPVDAAAGRERHDEFHEAVGPAWQRRSLRGRGAAEGEDGRRRRQGEEPAPVDHGRCRVRSHPSTLIFASWITGPHLSISDLRKAASSCGVEPTSVAPSCSNRSFTIGWSIGSRPPSPSRPLRREGARAHPRVSFVEGEATAERPVGQPATALRAAPRRVASTGCCGRAFAYFPCPLAIGGRSASLLTVF